MIILEELFKNLTEFRHYAPYSETNIEFKDLNSSASSARKQICIILSKEVYDIVLKKEGEIHDALLTAMANLTLAKQLVFDVVKQRKSDVDIYKYEMEAMRRSYIENYFSGMDTLIQLLDKEESLEEWKNSRYCKLLSSLRIQTAEDFDFLYSIDLSYLFFFRIIPLQKEVLDEGMTGYFERVVDNQEMKDLLLHALAKSTIALALRRLDILEFPSTIRNLFDDSKTSRSGKDEQERMLALAEQLTGEAQSLLKNIDLMLSNNDSGIVDTETSFNAPDDKIIMMP
ncbi:hypothetical protein NXX45_01775 [Bacteroides fragilis]|jgi:hypothetical protein|uniref:Uncharacterized protein n=1 Tax=Bacteroides fragilis TaxID=817 RepID=A0AAQ2NJ61_BACFG|nr:hypothetical protein [Bacteroides fragilis]MCM0248251.1 hypothetical protein [Bacteroides fragilis]MCM0256772.1 hypothetical protein [Bacteroides fragilis]MCS3110354.1 hypothetical protein [Bacteroides fragilis]UVR52564.1 hypothetical protein NXX84_01605 [Bacteroides fragilis]UVR56824.1 hypothetical protein NXX45_01775 [Bacteroides fragilis]